MTEDNKTPQRRHVAGGLESAKFESKREGYYEYVSGLKNMGYEFEDFLHYFPSFVGGMTISRVLALYECYKSVLGINGHVADIGIFRGSSSFLFAKLAEIFEPNSLTQVHGFDWFEGNHPDEWEKNIVPGAGKESYSRIQKLVKLQKLDHVLKIHKMDLTSDEIDKFFENNSHLRFKLVFMDAGMYKVVKKSLPYFWDRLAIGGRIIFDQYNFDIAPGETKAVDEFFKSKSVKIRTMPFGWMPTAYIEKESD